LGYLSAFTQPLLLDQLYSIIGEEEVFLIGLQPLYRPRV
jgi:hypothetical protein